jgi:hypothetical protein
MHNCSDACRMVKEGGHFHPSWHHISCPEWSHFVSETPASNDPHDQSEFKRNFDRIFDDVIEHNGAWEINRNGEAVAVLISYESYSQMMLIAGTASMDQ